jgi:salicylate hydroxylase
MILAEAQEVYDIPVIYDHTLVGLMENNNPTSAADEEDGSVTACFSNGVTDTASFVVGCDGLHSATRIALFGKEKAHFTGMTQVSNITVCFPSYCSAKRLEFSGRVGFV